RSTRPSGPMADLSMADSDSSIADSDRRFPIADSERLPIADHRLPMTSPSSLARSLLYFQAGRTAMKLVGLALIILGLVGVIYGGIRGTHQEDVVDIGPVQVTHDKTKSIPIPPIVGAVCLVAGTLILAGRARHA